MPEKNETNLNRGELLNKRIVLFTLCGITTVFSGTVCWLVLHAINVPDTLDRLVTFSVGNLTGILTATGLRNIMPNGTSDKPLVVAADKPLPVTDETPETDEDVPAPTAPNNPSQFAKVVRKN